MSTEQHSNYIAGEWVAGATYVQEHQSVRH